MSDMCKSVSDFKLCNIIIKYLRNLFLKKINVNFCPALRNIYVPRADLSTREVCIPRAVCQQAHIKNLRIFMFIIRVITKLPNTEQSSKGKNKTHKSINRQNQSTTGKLGKPQWPWLGTGISKKIICVIC